MNVSVIIPCYLLPDKEGELLTFTQDCINSLRTFSSDFELILIDNGSPCGTDYLMSEADIYIRNRVNLGYGPAVNQGLKVARGEWLVVANNDLVFIHDWITAAAAAWQPGTGAISAHLHDHDPNHRSGRRRVGQPGEMFGALWLTRREVVERVGYLDEGFETAYFEDTFFWHTLRAHGYELAKTGWVKHIGNATSGKIPNLNEIFLKNKKLFEEKLSRLNQVSL
jgi:GT2 family glycosyltransferase